MSEPVNAARRYLLGDLDGAEASALEERFMADRDAAAEIEREEETLIDDYLDGRLSPHERRRFEGHYFASPVHQRRVDVVRALRAAATPAQSYRGWWLAAAAAVIAAAVVGWVYRPASSTQVAVPAVTPPAQTAAAPPNPVVTPAPPPRVFAFALPAITVRSAAAPPPLVIPEGIGIVALDLQRDGANVAVDDPHATISTVEGRTVWQGEATITNLPAGVLARIEVPASDLRPDDYFVAISGFRYALRVRAR